MLTFFDVLSHFKNTHKKVYHIKISENRIFLAKNSKKIANFPSYGIMGISEWKHAVHVNDEWRELCSRYKEGFYEKK